VAERAHEQLAVVAVGAPVGRAARVGPVGRELAEHRAERRLADRSVAAQAPGEPVVGEGHGRDTSRGIRFGITKPPELRRRERCDRNDARAAGVLGGAHLVDQVARRLRRPRVIPEQRVTDDAAVGVEHDHAVLLPADRDRSDAVESARIGEGREQGAPPGCGVDLGAVGMGSAARAHERPGRGIPDHDLARLRRRVDAGDQCHTNLPLAASVAASTTVRNSGRRPAYRRDTPVPIGATHLRT
jgi:hypothetical protein